MMLVLTITAVIMFVWFRRQFTAMLSWLLQRTANILRTGTALMTVIAFLVGTIDEGLFIGAFAAGMTFIGFKLVSIIIAAIANKFDSYAHRLAVKTAPAANWNVDLKFDPRSGEWR